MKKINVLIVLGVVGILTASCCSCRKGVSRDHASLTGTKWTLTQLDGKAFAAKDNFYLNFDAAENSVSGMGDCNNLTGKYTLGENRDIDLGGIASTRKFCPDQQREDQFNKMLGRVDSYDIDGDLLMLFEGPDVIAVLKAEQQ